MNARTIDGDQDRLRPRRRGRGWAAPGLAGLLLAVALGLAACATGPATGAGTKQSVAPTPAVTKVNGWYGAFCRGLDEVDRRVFRVDEVKCRMWMWRDYEQKVWHLKVVRLPLPPSGRGEIQVQITDDGATKLTVDP